MSGLLQFVSSVEGCGPNDAGWRDLVMSRGYNSHGIKDERAVLPTRHLRSAKGKKNQSGKVERGRRMIYWTRQVKGARVPVSIGSTRFVHATAVSSLSTFPSHSSVEGKSIFCLFTPRATR